MNNNNTNPQEEQNQTPVHNTEPSFSQAGSDLPVAGSLAPEEFFIDDIPDDEPAVLDKEQFMQHPNHRCGYVAIAGLPNAGKSTLLNALLGEQLSVITPKPQTTRKTILGILNDPAFQIIFLDTPGILTPQYLLQEKMAGFISVAIQEADVVLFLADLRNDPLGEELYSHPGFHSLLKKIKAPTLLLLNKADTTDSEHTKQLLSFHSEKKLFSEVFAVSALHKFNLNVVLEKLLTLLPLHPKYFSEDVIAADSERFFVTEIIRGKMLELYQDEVPYSAEVQIEEFKETEGRKDFISATITVERKTQMGIVIGAKGAAIKQLSEYSRKQIEDFLGRPVFLELRVRVKEKWRNSAAKLKQFGYE